jgi:hypothetical protein
MTDFLSTASGGFLPSDGYTLDSTGYNSVATGGNLTVSNGAQIPAASSTPTIAKATSQVLIPSSIQSQLSGLITSGDPYGHTIVPTPTGYKDVGVNGIASQVKTGITNAMLTNNSTLTAQLNSTNLQSFTGTDLKLMIECASDTNTSQTSTYKVVLECHTLSISSYRVKNPVRSLGYTNPKGFSRGPRTIAGTLVLTEMSVDVLLSFLQAVVINDTSKDSNITKSDQLPPFNFTLVFANEEGAASYRRLLGVEFLNDGVVYSVQDMLIERTISWMATDFTPLLPLDTSSLYTHQINNATTVPAQKTPTDYFSNQISLMRF